MTRWVLYPFSAIVVVLGAMLMSHAVREKWQMAFMLLLLLCAVTGVKERIWQSAGEVGFDWAHCGVDLIVLLLITIGLIGGGAWSWWGLLAFVITTIMFAPSLIPVDLLPVQSGYAQTDRGHLMEIGHNALRPLLPFVASLTMVVALQSVGRRALDQVGWPWIVAFSILGWLAATPILLRRTVPWLKEKYPWLLGIESEGQAEAVSDDEIQRLDHTLPESPSTADAIATLPPHPPQ